MTPQYNKLKFYFSTKGWRFLKLRHPEIISKSGNMIKISFSYFDHATGELKRTIKSFGLNYVLIDDDTGNVYLINGCGYTQKYPRWQEIPKPSLQEQYETDTI